MTPEHREDLMVIGALAGGPQVLFSRRQAAVKAALALVDLQKATIHAQAAELAELRQVLAWALRDDDQGGVELGAARLRAEIVLGLQAEADARMRRQDALSRVRQPVVHESMELAKLNIELAMLRAIIGDLRADGPLLPPPPEEGELERLRAMEAALKRGDYSVLPPYPDNRGESMADLNAMLHQLQRAAPSAMGVPAHLVDSPESANYASTMAASPWPFAVPAQPVGGWHFIPNSPLLEGEAVVVDPTPGATGLPLVRRPRPGEAANAHVTAIGDSHFDVTVEFSPPPG